MNFAFQFLDFSTSQLSFVFYTFHLYFIHLCFIRDKFDSGEINTAFQVGSSKEPHLGHSVKIITSLGMKL